MFLRVLSFSLRTAFSLSYVVSIEARDPFANENANTPTNITNEQNALSALFPPEISPYPTVVIVVIVQ